MYFPLAGSPAHLAGQASGRRKEPPPSAEALWGQRHLQPEKPLISGKLPGGLHSFARSSSPDRAKKEVSSVLSVPLW